MDDIRQKAKERKEAMLKKLEAEKKEEIEKVMGEKIDTIKGDKLEKQINPEVLRLEALIRSVKTILRATPAYKVVSLEDLYNLLQQKVKTSLEEIESIIIGLKNKNEIKGEYDIWSKQYYGSNITRRFIEKTLNDPQSLKGLESVKIRSDGSVEFNFHVLEDEEQNFTAMNVKSKLSSETREKPQKKSKKA